MPELRTRIRNIKKKDPNRPLYTRPGYNAHGPLQPPGGSPPPSEPVTPGAIQGAPGAQAPPPLPKRGEKPDFGELREAHEGLRGRLKKIKGGLPEEPTEQDTEQLTRLRAKLQDLRFARQDFPGHFGASEEFKGTATSPLKPGPQRPSLSMAEMQRKRKKTRPMRGSIDVA